jgi:hypothetical protein
MSHESTPNSELRISETDLRRILDRAIQLDTQRTAELTLAEVRRVADEVGISPVALTQALDEHRLGQINTPMPIRPIEPAATGWLERARRLLRPAWLASLSTVLSFISAMSGAEELAVGTFMLGIGASFVLAIMHRLRRREAVEASEAAVATPAQLHEGRNAGWAFLIDMLALWAPWIVLNGLVEEEIALVGGVAWALVTVVGFGIVAFINPRPKYPVSPVSKGEFSDSTVAP